MFGSVWRPTEILAASVLENRRNIFKAAVAAGQAKPLNIPYDFIPGFFIPILYMSLPHTKTPWLYSARWIVFAFVVVFNVHMMSITSSTNVALSYATGLWGLWAIIHNFTMLICMRPQFEAERVVRRKKKEQSHPGDGVSSSVQPADVSHGERLNGSAVNGQVKDRVRTGERTTTQAAAAPGADTNAYDYYWQCFPEDGTFWERFDWAFDLYATFRGAGWNWAVPVIPNPRRPEKAKSGEAVRMDTVPLSTPGGYVTYRTAGEFYRAKLLACLFAYLSVDFLKVFMMKDPFFIVGPSAAETVPAHLAALPLWAVHALRNVLFLLAVYTAILGIISAHDIFQFRVMRYVYPLRGELWQHSSAFGSFSKVLDRGLAGFWGAWWHQTFRIAFSGPGDSLARGGYLEKGSWQAKLVTMFLAFLQSGLLHGCGSWTSIPDTKTWYPLVFFMFSGLGVVVQQLLCFALRPQIAVLPRWTRCAGNLAYVALWLHFTCWPLAHDFACVGIWLLEPVPLSLARAMRLGQIDHNIWRIDGDSLPGWISGKHWWQSGIGG